MVRFTLSKQERLSSLREIEALFEKGQSLSKYPFRLVWNQALTPDTVPVKVMFSVSKKKFSGAVDRNRVKRLMREAYRHLKPGLYAAVPSGTTFSLGIIFTGKEMPDYAIIQKKLAAALEQFTHKIRET